MGVIGNCRPWNFGSPIPSTVQFFSFILSCIHVEEGRELGCYKVGFCQWMRMKDNWKEMEDCGKKVVEVIRHEVYLDWNGIECGNRITD